MTHTSTEQPEALRLAEMYDFGDPAAHGNAWKSAVCTELRRLHARVQELEASQAQRVPLSDAEIGDFWEGATGGHSFNDETRRDFVRSIEQAHGITQEKQQ